MIGQQKLITLLTEMKYNLPRFIVLVGQKGSGKKTVAREFIPTLFEDKPIVYQLPDCKVDTVREMITNAYSIQDTTLYIISDADSMSESAKNAMLKITEEPPNNAYFVMTIEDMSHTLDTIRSRSTVMSMGIYSTSEITDYYTQNYDGDVDDSVVKLCETPYEVDLLKAIGVERFYDYVSLVVDNIAEVSGVNAFKIADKIAFKEEEDKYDLKLFLKAFEKVCTQRITETSLSSLHDVSRYASGIYITSKYIGELERIRGVNKQMTFDSWLLEIRREWM